MAKKGFFFCLYLIFYPYIIKYNKGANTDFYVQI